MFGSVINSIKYNVLFDPFRLTWGLKNIIFISFLSSCIIFNKTQTKKEIFILFLLFSTWKLTENDFVFMIKLDSLIFRENFHVFIFLLTFQTHIYRVRWCLKWEFKINVCEWNLKLWKLIRFSRIFEHWTYFYFIFHNHKNWLLSIWRAWAWGNDINHQKIFQN